MQQLFEWITQMNLSMIEILLVIICLGIIHPIISQPMHTLGVTLTIYYFGLIQGVILLFIANLIGITFYYFIVNGLNHKIHLENYPQLKPAFQWLSRTPGYKHSIAVGLPLVPTYFIKLALPISDKRFIDYFLIMAGSYVILFSFNISFYYGILVIFFTGNLTIVTFIVFVIFIIFLYTINIVRSKWMKHQIKS